MAGYLQHTFLFGSYPQTPVAEQVQCAALAVRAGEPEKWAELNPKARFCDVFWEGARCRGLYTAGRVMWFRFRPVRWTAVGKEGNRLFLRSDCVLDAQPFNRTVVTCTYPGSGPHYYRCPDRRARGVLAGWEYAWEDGDYRLMRCAESRDFDIGKPDECANANCFAGSELEEWLNGTFAGTAFGNSYALFPAEGREPISARAERVLIEGPQTRQFPAGGEDDAPHFCTPYALAAGCERPHWWRADGADEEGAKSVTGLQMTGHPCEIAGVLPVVQCILID